MDVLEAYEYGKGDGAYCYPNSKVLKNKLNLTNEDELWQAERDISAIRIAELKMDPIVGGFDLVYLQAIHKAIFFDIYPWAGQLRTVNIAKGNPFCNSRFLQDYSNEVFGQLKKENFLLDTPAEEIPERLSYYLSEINSIHPFREGNGRAQRVFIEQLAQSVGYHVDFSQVTAEEMIEASKCAFDCAYELMDELFRRITTPLGGKVER